MTIDAMPFWGSVHTPAGVVLGDHAGRRAPPPFERGAGLGLAIGALSLGGAVGGALAVSLGREIPLAIALAGAGAAAIAMYLAAISLRDIIRNRHWTSISLHALQLISISVLPLMFIASSVQLASAAVLMAGAAQLAIATTCRSPCASFYRSCAASMLLAGLAGFVSLHAFFGA